MPAISWACAGRAKPKRPCSDCARSWVSSSSRSTRRRHASARYRKSSLIVHVSQRQHSRRGLPVRDASENEGNLNSRVWIFQKLDVVQRAVSFAQLQLNVRTRENVAVSLAKVFKRGTFVPRTHRDRRRRRRNEIDQQ